MKKLILLFLLFSVSSLLADVFRADRGIGIGPKIWSVKDLGQAYGPPVSAMLQPPEEDKWERKVPFIAARRIPEFTEVKDEKGAGVDAPVLGVNFSALASEGKAQPDAIIAAGPAHVLAAVNHRIAVFTKTGVLRFVTDFDSWFAPISNVFAGALLFDPQVIYDQYTKHYLFLVTARRADKRSWYLLSVSKTSNPLGEWAYYAIDMQIVKGVRHKLWADFPRLGLDEKAIYLTANMFTFGSLIYRFPKVVVIKKSDLYEFGPLKYYEFAKFNDATGIPARNIHAAHSYGPAPVGYLVNTRNDTADRITVYAISHDEETPVMRRIGVNVSSYQMPPFALQKKGTNVMATATEGTGVLSATYRKGFLYTVHPVAHVWKTETVSALRYYKIDTTGKVIEEITYGSDRLYYYMPAVAVNAKGDVVMVFNRSGRNEYAGIFFSGRKGTAPAGKFSAAVPLHRGESNFEVPFNGTNINHWGDYNGICVDPTDNSFWIFGEYAQTVSTWNTWIGRVWYP